MASKKEKHARMLEKRAAREAAVAEVGRKALEADRAQRKLEEARMWEDAHKVHLKRNRFHDKCEHCSKLKAQQAIDRLAKATAKATAKARENYTPDPDGKHPGVTGNILTEDEARAMDQESAARVKGVMQELGLVPRTVDNASIDLTRAVPAHA